MANNIKDNINQYLEEFSGKATLVAVSKTKPNEDLLEAYEAGQRVFGENKIQEMTDKHESLPKDIEWHMIGHVQTNKVKYMAPYVTLVHAVHKLKLLKEINKRAKENNRVIECLLQVKIAEEDSKYGMDAEDVDKILASDAYQQMENVKVVGLMGMATLTDDETQINNEFAFLKNKYDEVTAQHKEFKILSMGMSGDYKIALQHGSNMIRIGSAIFGARNYN
ncbi:YggS family pyridoxal phosphate-dependent enzyme [Mesonia aestuariivivens]|uniref:Pyridoxal phosphate homeostasis protein n=1 Tax=Mesonia aestuariivivens TaxID=2796128 RepID=A0ABS6W014_9FLAO|nr:YggS family pyridoxal phosphate-dependent enzyme [Mesonia aestuariivivens]MBW2961176.1 YggS family pyridoxal phosphate-dependent enzyme [Mesonia aestuariivivens]